MILVVGMTALVEAQRRGGRRGGMMYVMRPEHITWNSDFTFCRLAYRNANDGDGGGWGVDYPRADMNLPIRLSELTKAPVNFDESHEPNHVVIQATEDELFKCPFVMMSEFGGAYITPEEATALQELSAEGRLSVGRRCLGRLCVAALGAASFAKCCLRARTRSSTCR